jgi:hypothetical protein
MKTIITCIFLFISILSKGQTSDIMYVPDQKVLVLTYNNDFNGLGFYMGGYIKTSFPAPYIYTTPISIINRVGISISNKKVSLMGGCFTESFRDNLKLQPDVWFKIYPLRIFLNTTKGPDFTLGLNYMKGFHYGLGLSLPLRGIY